MEDSFKNAADKSEPSGFDLAKALHEKLRYSNPALAFGVTRELVVLELKDLGTDRALATVLEALSPETQNIDLEDRIKLPFSDHAAKKSLRDLVFPKPETYAETGSDSNRQLARILNKLSALGKKDPIDAMRRHDTGDHVLHLPVDPQAARDAKILGERLRKGQEYKAETLKTLMPELQALLYDGRRSISTGLQYALYIMNEKLVDSAPVQKAVGKLLDDFGSIGAIVRDGNNFKEAVNIMKRVEAARAPKKAATAVPAKEIS